MTSDTSTMKIECLLRRLGVSGVPRPVLVGIVCISLALVVFGIWRFWPTASADSASFQVTTDEATQAVVDADADESGEEGEAKDAASEGNSTTELFVDVEGAVVSPGVYAVADGSRVVDAVNAAGGLRADAQRSSINLAAQVEDGMQLYVYSTEEAGTAASLASSSTAAAGSSGSQSSSSSGGKINLNTASTDELQELSGIGPALSQRIVDYREQQGRFDSIEELKEVSGIGDTRYEALKDLVCV